jgi:hypothetical protein
MMRLGMRSIAMAVLSFVAAPLGPSATTVGGPVFAPLQAADTVKVVLAEVLFAPAPAATSFVELANVGTKAVDLSSLVLRIDTLVMPLPRLTEPLAPGGRVLVRFDGGGTIEGNVVHAPSDFALRAEGGTVTLLWNDDRVIDRVAWGDVSDAIMPPRGGIPPARVDAGSSFGRPPGANQPGASTDWVIYPADQVTPGRANPLPAVAQLLPLNGAILQATAANLSWYPVPGAVRYRVQLARDTTFAQTILDQTINVATVNSGQLAAGAYWWRVQAIPNDGPAAAWSHPSRIEFEGRSGGGGADGDTSGEDDGDADASAALGDPYLQDIPPVTLPVPMIYQHKDGPMLLLESQQSGGLRTAGRPPGMPHAWDRDHRTLDQHDPADNMNCGLATMAMLNRFYGGDLTQDRIGYEVFGPNVANYEARIPAGLVLSGTTLRERTPGPERDLNYGYGLWNRQFVAAGIFALGAPPGPGSGFGPGYTVLPTLWNTIVQEIHAGRPLAGIIPGHLLVIRGYEIRNGKRLIWVNDPWSGPYAMYFNSGPSDVQAVFAWPSHPAIGHLEPESKRDSDGDGVWDFDEVNRFHTNPNKADSDADGVSDKQDIESGVYEDEHRLGYAWNPSYGSPGRDFDADGKAPELDFDSDNGGCKDGDEDVSHDGYRDSTETGNFDQTDDLCGDLRGNVSYLIEAVTSHPDEIVKIIHESAVILVRLRRESPGSHHFVDDSSTFTYSGFARGKVAIQNCDMWGRELSHYSGVFTGDADIGALAEGDTMALGIRASVEAQTAGGSCVGAGTGTTERTMSFPDCDGVLEKPTPGSPPRQRTYRFSCTKPPDLGPRWTVTQFYARGFVRIQ